MAPKQAERDFYTFFKGNFDVLRCRELRHLWEDLFYSSDEISTPYSSEGNEMEISLELQPEPLAWHISDTH